ncbi:hypothetical protein DFH27DRAFT_601496 [Peziza echinospora]|nr:hypothetical protein DFH27DRAFT_601496 [Peziza echinospora]
MTAAAIPLRRGLAGLCRLRAQANGAGRNPMLRAIAPMTTSPRLRVTAALPRLFSTTSSSQRQVEGPLPLFPPTSNQTLDHLLSTLHDELFVPPHLLSRHRNLIYRHKNHPLLLEEPIYYTVSNQAIHLTPKQNVPSLPRSLFTKCINSMETPRDFDVVPGLLLGYTQAGRPLLPQHHEKFARAAALAGRADVILQALDNAELNSFKANKQLVRNTFLGLFVQNHQSTFHAASKALKRTKRLHKLLTNPKIIDLGTCHAPEKLPENPSKEQVIARKEKLADFRNDPILAGVTAGLFASTSLRFAPGGVDNALSAASNIRQTFLAWALLEKEIASINHFTATESAEKRLADPASTSKEKKEFERVYNRVKYSLLAHQFLVHSFKDAAKVFKNTIDAISTPGTPEIQLAAIYSTDPLVLPREDAVAPSAPLQEKIDLLKFVREAAPRLVLETSSLEQTIEKWAAWVKKNDPYVQKRVLAGEQAPQVVRLDVQTYLEAAERLEEWIAREKESVEHVEEEGEKEGSLQDEVAWA